MVQHPALKLGDGASRQGPVTQPLGRRELGPGATAVPLILVHLQGSTERVRSVRAGGEA